MGVLPPGSLSYHDRAMVRVSVKDVSGHLFVKALAEFLKRSGKISQPEWTDIVKLSAANQLSPYDPDWFYIRCAAILRHLYIRPTGMHGLTQVFSRKMRNGTKPSHRCLAHRTVIRKALQQLEAVGLCAVQKDGGRAVTSEGRRDLDRLAKEVLKA